MIDRVPCASVIAAVSIGMCLACGSKPGSEGVPAPPPVAAPPRPADAAVAPVVPSVPVAPVAPVAPSVDEAQEPPEAPPDYATVLASADPWKGPRVRHQTAVLLVAPRLSWKASDGSEPVADGRFQPLVCAIDGVRATGARCGEVMPGTATIRTPAGELVVQRSKQPFHDQAGEQTYPAPYGPACCTYNTCRGKTVPYAVARRAKGKGEPRTVFAVWPADADLALEVAGDGLVGVTPAQLPKHPADQQVVQAFTRGDHTYASVSGRSDGTIAWDPGTGWITGGRSTRGPGPRGFKLLATTDVDHDGHPELVAYELWANDYGLDVFGDSDAKPIYDFSCGNI